jgi:CBS domain-containing protein
LGYKEKTAGGIMTSEFLAMPQTATVDMAIERLRSLSENHERTHYVYTLDEANQLAGAIDLRSLVLAEKSTTLGNLASTGDLITVTPDVDQEEVADQISKYNLLAIPVVDENQKLLGLVTVDDAIDVLEEEHSEDIQMISGTSRSRDSQSVGLSDMLLWLLRRSMWFIIWALFAISVTMAGLLQKVLPSLVFAPFVLLVTQEAIAYAFNDLLEYGSAKQLAKAPQIILRNMVASLFLAITASGLGAVLFGALGSAVDNSSPASFTPHPLHILLVQGFLPAVLSAALVTIASALVTLWGRRQLEKDRPLSALTTTFAGMLFSLGLLVGLQFLLGLLIVFN